MAERKTITMNNGWAMPMKKSVFEKFKNDFTLTGAILDVDGKVKKTGEIRYITTNRNIHPYEQSLIDLLSNLENANK